MVGQETRAPAPRTSIFTGTSRHPSTGRPSRHDRGGAAERVMLAREEEGADGERLAGRKRQAVSRRFAVEQRGGDLGEQARAVARAVGGRGAAMGHPSQRLQREASDIGGALSGCARHEPYAAGIVLPPGVQVRRAAVGPTRSVGCGHRVSSSRPVNKKARSIGSGPGVCFESPTRLRPPPAPIGGSRRVQNSDGLQRTVVRHVGATQEY